MNTERNNTPSEQLSALLDGELEQSESPQLFYELAGSPELQEEMRDLITMRKLINKSMPIPPDRLKKNILMSAGLLAASDVSGGEITTLKDRILNIFSSRIFSAFAAAAVGSLLTVYFMGMLQPGKYIGGEYSVTAIENGSPKTKQIAVVSSTDITQKPRLQQSESLPAQDVRAAEPEYFIPVMNIAEMSSPAISKNSGIAPNPRFSNIIISGEQFKYIPAANNKYFLELRAFSALSFPNPGISPISKPALNNIGIALLYKINDEHYAGIEIGQENFLQSYKGMRDGVPIIIDQNYLGFWGAAVYQYNPKLNGFEMLAPFARFSAGATEMGPIGKIMLGMKYNLTDNLALVAGAEGSLLVYRYNNSLFTTRKIGATGGFSINF